MGGRIIAGVGGRIGWNTHTAVAVICHGLSELDVDELKEVIDYCEERIDELQRDEVESLEAEMRAIARAPFSHSRCLPQEIT
jgi:hypothetical protein